MGRLQLIAEAQKYVGTPYIYNGKGPYFDCSGYITELIEEATGHDWRHTHNAARLFEVCPRIPEADEYLENITAGAPHWPCPGVQPGDLVFYFDETGTIVDHVMLVVGDGRVLGASGGDHTTTTLEEAARRHACVHFKDSVDYRPHFAGYRAFPFVVTLEG